MDDENEILIEEKEASRAMHAYTLPCAYKFLQFLQVVITNYSSYATSIIRDTNAPTELIHLAIY